MKNLLRRSSRGSRTQDSVKENLQTENTECNFSTVFHVCRITFHYICLIMFEAEDEGFQIFPGSPLNKIPYFTLKQKCKKHISLKVIPFLTLNA